MRLSVQKPSVRLFLATLTLVAGEAVGFACARVASGWGFLAGIAGLGFLAAWGWGVRGLGSCAIFVLGVVLALHCEADLQRILDANAGLMGPRRSYRLRVEGEVSAPRRTKKGVWQVAFPSHVGRLPLTVVLPLESLRAARPQTDEVWSVDGWIGQRKEVRRRYDRRIFHGVGGRTASRLAPAPSGVTWSRIGDELARRAGAGLEWNEELASLNRAILLGRRTDLAPERRQTFIDAGTIHLFAISGLHVMVVTWFLGAAFKRLGMPVRLCGLASLPLVVAYVVLTGARPSAVRAACMAAICLVAPAFGRRPDSLTAWSVTAFIVYAVSPQRLYDLGCVFSFVVMFGVLLWVRWTGQFEPICRPGTRAEKFAGYLQGVGVSVAAWIAGVPLAASLFGRITPGGLLANAVVVMCANLMVRIGAGALAVSLLCLPLAAILNNAAAALTWVMASVSGCVARLPFATFDVEPWGVAPCVLWYAAWLAFFAFLGRLLPPKGLQTKKWW